MKKLFVLLKKDIYLDPLNIIMIIVLAFGIPLVVGHLLEDVNYGNGSVILMMSAMYCLYFGQNKVSGLEYKYKGLAYLTLTPYKRAELVLSKYIFLFLLYVVCIVFYYAAYFVSDSVAGITFLDIALTGLIQILFWSIYLPLEYKLGYNNIKNYFAILFISMPWIVSFFNKQIVVILNILVKNFVVSVLSICVVSVLIVSSSIFLSIRIFSRKSL